LQDLIDNSGAVMTFMNWVYIWGHWPVITAVLLWLFLRHPPGYREVRNTMLLSGGIGLVVFVLYPVAPPRLAELGLVDTVTEYSTAYRVLQPPAFVNQYAAMPSLHVGWDLLMGIAMVTWSSHVAVRIIGVVLPTLMAISVVLTANHYLIDAVAGVALVLACLWVVRSRALRRVARPVLPAQRSGSDPVSDTSAAGDGCLR
jgi:membrane-associated phospholipid phosphatase